MNMQSVSPASLTNHQSALRFSHNPSMIELLAEQHKTEILDFLAERPLHTVYLAGFVLDNGVVSPLNRGSFYGYRNSKGQLEGVALIGHATLFEIRSDEALSAFAGIAQIVRART